MSRGARSSSSKLHQLSWLWRAPRRALGAARDLYVRSLTGCAGRLPGDAGAAFGCPTFGGMPEYYSFSASSSRRAVHADDDADDLRELIRAASQRRRAAEAEAAASSQQQPTAVPRSQSVASMARIDEDRPCEEFGAMMFLPRSRTTCAGGRRGRVAALAA